MEKVRDETVRGRREWSKRTVTVEDEKEEEGEEEEKKGEEDSERKKRRRTLSCAHSPVLYGQCVAGSTACVSMCHPLSHLSHLLSLSQQLEVKCAGGGGSSRWNHVDCVYTYLNFP